MEYTVVAH